MLEDLHEWQEGRREGRGGGVSYQQYVKVMQLIVITNTSPSSRSQSSVKSIQVKKKYMGKQLVLFDEGVHIQIILNN